MSLIRAFTCSVCRNVLLIQESHPNRSFMWVVASAWYHRCHTERFAFYFGARTVDEKGRHLFGLIVGSVLNSNREFLFPCHSCLTQIASGVRACSVSLTVTPCAWIRGFYLLWMSWILQKNVDHDHKSTRPTISRNVHSAEKKTST